MGLPVHQAVGLDSMLLSRAVRPKKASRIRVVLLPPCSAFPVDHTRIRIQFYQCYEVARSIIGFHKSTTLPACSSRLSLDALMGSPTVPVLTLPSTTVTTRRWPLNGGVLAKLLAN